MLAGLEIQYNTLHIKQKKDSSRENKFSFQRETEED